MVQSRWCCSLTDAEVTERVQAEQNTEERRTITGIIIFRRSPGFNSIPKAYALTCQGFKAC